MSTTIGILLFDDLEELDAIGPWEVFTMAAQQQVHRRVVAALSTSQQFFRVAVAGGSHGHAPYHLPRRNGEKVPW